MPFPEKSDPPWRCARTASEFVSSGIPAPSQPCAPLAGRGAPRRPSVSRCHGGVTLSWPVATRGAERVSASFGRVQHLRTQTLWLRSAAGQADPGAAQRMPRRKGLSARLRQHRRTIIRNSREDRPEGRSGPSI
jgi:hypothetical protein